MVTYCFPNPNKSSAKKDVAQDAGRTISYILRSVPSIQNAPIQMVSCILFAAYHNRHFCKKTES